MVLRGLPSQREVTRCGCHGSARVAPLFPELEDACGGRHYGGRMDCSGSAKASQEMANLLFNLLL